MPASTVTPGRRPVEFGPPGAPLESGESSRHPVDVSGCGSDEEQPRCTGGSLDRRQRLNAQFRCDVSHTPTGLLTDGGRAVGVVVRHNTLTASSERTDFIEVGVIHRLCAMPRSTVAAWSEAVIRVDKDDIAVISSS